MSKTIESMVVCTLVIAHPVASVPVTSMAEALFCATGMSTVGSKCRPRWSAMIAPLSSGVGSPGSMLDGRSYPHCFTSRGTLTFEAKGASIVIGTLSV